MPTNDFLSWAIGGGANVETQVAYLADPKVGTGEGPGTAVSARSNKVWRQASQWAYVCAQTVCDVLGVDALDNGTPATLLANFKLAIANLAWNTGNVRCTYQTSSVSGWLMLADQTIGNVGSGAIYANANALALFTLLYNVVIDANAPVFTSAGTPTTRGAQGTAATAWAAGVRLQLCSTLGRSLGAAGSGAGLTPRSLGSIVGEEAHQLVITEIAPHSHVQEAVNGNGPNAQQGGPNAGGITTQNTNSTGGAGSSSTGGPGNPAVAHNNMQPTSFLNAEIKL